MYACACGLVASAASSFVGKGLAYGKTIFIREKGEGFEKKFFFFCPYAFPPPSTSTVVRLKMTYNYKNLATEQSQQTICQYQLRALGAQPAIGRTTQHARAYESD